MSSKIKIQKPLKDFLKVVFLSIIYVTLMVGIIYSIHFHPEIAITLVIIAILTFIFSPITYLIFCFFKGVVQKKYTFAMFKLWFSKNIITFEKR